MSLLGLRKDQENILLAGLTAAKKIIAVRWKHPHCLSHRQWVLTFIDIAYLELSTARIHNAKEETINLWNQTVSDLKNVLL